MLGDLNANVGSDRNTWNRVLGKHGRDNLNPNEELLLRLYREYNSSITNTFLLRLRQTILCMETSKV